MGAGTTPLGLAVALVGGAVIGALFFGGLWLTIGRISTARAPALLVLGSFLLRTLLATAGFVLLASGSWVQLLVGLGGFLVARLILARRLGPTARPSRERGSE